MKIWTTKCDLKSYCLDGPDIKLGIGWFRHSPKHKWKGLTINICLYFWLVTINIVDNYQEYQKKISYKRDPDHIKKLGERLRKKK